MQAWVIRITSLDAAKKGENATRVISLVSARRRTDYIEQYLENLFSIFLLNLEWQRQASKYNNPHVPIRATSLWGSVVYCSRHPYYFIGELSEIIDIKRKNGLYWLRWKGVKYQKYAVDSETHSLLDLGEVDPPVQEAPQSNFRVQKFFE